MALQLSVTARNDRLNAIETTIGTAPLLRLYDLTAGAPANCAAAITATLVAEMTLPSDWMDAAASGAKAKSASAWQDTSANNAGTVDFFRILESTGTTTHVQGTVTATGGGGDMELDNAVVAAGQQITITTFTLTDGNA